MKGFKKNGRHVIRSKYVYVIIDYDRMKTLSYSRKILRTLIMTYLHLLHLDTALSIQLRKQV